MSVGVGAPTPTWTINDAVDAYQRNSSTVPTTVILKGSTTDIQQNMDVLKAMMGNGITISSIKLTDHAGHIDLDSTTLTTGGTHNLNTSTNATAEVLQKISGAYTLNIGNATVSDVTTGFTPPTGATIKMKVVDTAANVGAALTTLTNNKSKLTSITLADPSNTISVTVPQIATYRAVLGIVSSYKLNVTSASIKDYTSKLSTSAGSPPVYTTNSNVGKISINDTAANINANISLLQSLAAAGTLNQITVSDGKAVTLTQANALADTQLLATKFVNGAGGATQTVTVSGVDVADMNAVENQAASNTSIDLGEQISDSSANISSNLTKIANAISANHIGRISFTDGSTPTLTFVNKADYTANSSVLQFVRGNYNLSIGNISAADAVAFTAPNSNASLKFNISDTAANLATNFDALQTLAAAGKVTTIKSTDAQGKTIDLTATQVLKDSAVFTALNAGGSPYSVNVTGAKASDIANLTTALTDAGSVDHLSKISFSDTAANLQANMSNIVSLAATTTISKVSVTDGATNALNIQGSLLDNGGSLVTGAASLFGATFDDGAGGAIQVNVQGIAASHAKDVNDLIVNNSTINGSGSSTLADETVSDTAANISSNMNSLETAAAETTPALQGITVRDGGTVTVADINEFTADKKAIDLITPNYKLAVTSASVADAATVNADTTVAANAKVSFGISDTAANITSHLSNLSTLVNNNQVSSIVSSDGTNKNITFTATQIGTYSNVLNKITTGSVEVTGATATQAAKWLSSTPPLSSNISKIDIDLHSASDASDLVKNIAALNANYTKVGTINLGANALTLDATTAKANTNLLSNADFSPSTSGTGGHGAALTVNGLAVSDLSLSSVTGIAANATLALTDNITDTAAHVSSNLDALQANSAIGTVKVSDTNPVTVSSTAQYTKDLTLLSTKLSGNVTLSASGLSVADALNLAKVTAPGKMSYKIVDTAANITAHLADLKTFASLGELSQVTTTDNTSKAITVDLGSNTVSDLNSVISKIQGSGTNQHFAINVTGATAAQATSLQGILSAANSNATLSTVSIDDTGADITANLANLQTLAASNHIGTIDVSDGTLALTSAQVTSSSNLLASTFTNGTSASDPVAVTVTGVAAANIGATLLAVNSNSELHIAEVDVSDTAANLQSNIASLEAGAAGGLVQKIAASDGGTITLDETSNNADSPADYTPGTPGTANTTEVTVQYQHALAAMTGTYGVTVTGISSTDIDAAYANIVTAATNGTPTVSFGVVDDNTTLNGANAGTGGQSTYLDVLQSYAAAHQLSSITLASGSDPLQVTVAQIQSDGDALAKLDKSPGTLAITDAAGTIVDTSHPENLADVNSLIANHGAANTTIVLTDSNVDLSIGQLNSLNTTLNSATGSDLTTQLSPAIGFSYNIQDHIGAILNQATLDAANGTTLVSGAGQIKLTDDYTSTILTLPTSQKPLYTNLYSSMQDSQGNSAPDPTDPTKVTFV